MRGGLDGAAKLAILGTSVLLTSTVPGCLGGPSEAPPPSERSQAPDFAFTDLDGRSANLSDFRGTVVVIDLITLNCASCIQESEALKAAAASAGNFTLLLLDLVSSDPPDGIREYAMRHGTERTLAAYAPQSLLRAYNIVSADWNAVIDASGGLVWTDGGLTSEQTFRRVLASATS